MREKGSRTSSLLWRIMIGVTLIVIAGAFVPDIQAQERGKVARARNHNRGAAPQSDPRPGEEVNLTAVCSGRLEYRGSEPGAVAQQYENVTIELKGGEDKFTIAGADPSLAGGQLSVRTMSRNRKHLALAVNLTFNPPASAPVFSISMRGCYNRSNELCEDPAKGQGRIDNTFRLYTVPGDLRLFSFESASCTSEPQISRR